MVGDGVVVDQDHIRGDTLCIQGDADVDVGETVEGSVVVDFGDGVGLPKAREATDVEIVVEACIQLWGQGNGGVGL